MKKILATCLLTSFLAAGCLGPFNAFRSINNWNAKATDVEAVNEVIFVAMWIIPVYQIVAWSDVLVFNTIDYWSGNNPLTEPGPFPETWGKGKDKDMDKDKDK